jgi:hypothetical protein
LLVEAIVPEVSISVGPNPARAGDKVTVAGSLSEPVEATTCAVSLDDVPVDSSCSIVGVVITGSFTVSSEIQAGAAEVVVCEPECQGPVIHWRASTSLTIELASVEPTPDPSTPDPSTPVASTPIAATIAVPVTPPPAETVQVPDLAELDFQNAEKTLQESGLRIEVSGDQGGRVTWQSPIAGDAVALGTVVRVTLSADVTPIPASNGLLLVVITVVAMLAIGATALTIRYRARRWRDPRWVGQHLSVVPTAHFPIYHADPFDPDDLDFEIEVVANSHQEMITTVEVPT